MKRILSVFFVCCVAQLSCFAFRPVGHVVLQRTIAEHLSADNVFKIAMDAHPDFAAWGSVGPDLAYVPFKALTPKIGFVRKLGKSLNYADIAHYYRAGSFCKELIRQAIASGDKRLVAFAAGWLTHVAGDFGAHGIFVYPEAGNYLGNVDGRDLHGELEKYAESVIFVDKGKLLHAQSSFYSKDSLTKKALFDNFFNMPYGLFKVSKRKRIIRHNYQIIDDFMERVFESVYTDQYEVDVPYAMKQYDQAFGKGIGAFGDFGIVSYDLAISKLTDSQEVNLSKAFDFAAQYGVNLLEHCLENNFRDFTDRWNLDEGPLAQTLVVKIKLARDDFSGSTNPLYIHLKLETAQTARLTYKLKETKNVRYNKGETIYSYVALDNCSHVPDKLYAFTIEKKGRIRDKTAISSIVLEYNGQTVFESKQDFELNFKKPVSEEFTLSKPLND